MRPQHTYIPSPRKAGYSLVEVSLALLVVAIGLTSTFALFPEAMKNTRAAVSDTEVALFADYVFSTLAVAAAADGANFSIADTHPYASRALTDQDASKIRLDDSGDLARFYWIPKDDSQGTGDEWGMTQEAGFWTTAFSYKLTYDPRTEKGKRTTIYAVLKVWPGEWMGDIDEKVFKPYVFYREILPYPDL